MNIFCLDREPHRAARWLCDAHCIKMCLESVQLLQDAFDEDLLAHAPLTKKGTIRKHFNPKHPSSIWARKTTENFSWLLAHAQEIFEEKYRRYPNGGRHFSHDFFDWVLANQERANVPTGPLTEFSVAINSKSRCCQLASYDSLDSVGKYRAYYALDKTFATWKANKPDWLEKFLVL